MMYIPDRDIPIRNTKWRLFDSVITLLFLASTALFIHAGIFYLEGQIILMAAVSIGFYSWKYGINKGIVFTLSFFVILTLILKFHPMDLVTSFFPKGFVTLIIYLLSAICVGGISNLYQKLKMTEELYRKEHEKSELLLSNILPEQIATRLKNGEVLIADRYEETSIMFCDIVGFTKLAQILSPRDLVHLLNEIISTFDFIAERLGLEKIKTIGDAYLVVAGLPNKEKLHAELLAEMALEIMETIQKNDRFKKHQLQMRIGINSGPVIGGVIGHSKFTFDLWGDTVNLASRLESCGQNNKIHISTSTRNLLGPQYKVEACGLTDLKSYGKVETWYLTGRQI